MKIIHIQSHSYLPVQEPSFFNFRAKEEDIVNLLEDSRKLKEASIEPLSDGYVDTDEEGLAVIDILCHTH